LILLSLALARGQVQSLPANYQVDVIGSALLDTDKIRVCVNDQRIHEEALGHGRIAVTDLTDPITVSIHHIVKSTSLGHTETLSLSVEDPYIEVDWTVETIEKACTMTRPKAEIGSFVLAVHFIE